MSQRERNHEPSFAHLLQCAAAGARLRIGRPRRAAQAAGAGGRPVGGRPARLFLCRRQICGRARQGDHAGAGLCGGAGAEGRAPALSAGADPRRRPDGDQLDGNAGRTQGLGGVFRRAGLRRLHDRPAHARPLGGASVRWPDADVHGGERGVSVHRHRNRGHLAAGEEAHAMAGRWPQQGQEGRSGFRRVLRDPGRDRDLQRGDAEAQPGCRRRAARQDRAGDRADAFAVGLVRLAHRRCPAAARQGDRRHRAGGPAVRKRRQRHRQGARLGTDRHRDHL